MKTKYKMGTWKLTVDGEYVNEADAIKDLAHEYMRRSKCDLPGEHPLEALSGGTYRDISTIGKGVIFYVYEKVNGYMQWVIKYKLTIHPFLPDHWWEPTKPGIKIPEATEFKYEINPDE